MKSDQNGAHSFTSNRARIIQTVPLHEKSTTKLGLIFLKNSCEILCRPHWHKLTGIRKADHFKNVIDGRFRGFLERRKRLWEKNWTKRFHSYDSDNLEIVIFSISDLKDYYSDPINSEFEKSYNFIKGVNACYVAIDLKTGLFGKTITYCVPKFAYASKKSFITGLKKNLEAGEDFNSRYQIYKISEQFIIRMIQKNYENK